jgi:hypothetical protein
MPRTGVRCLPQQTPVRSFRSCRETALKDERVRLYSCRHMPSKRERTIMADAPTCPECGIEIRINASMMIKMGESSEDWAAKCKDAAAVQSGLPRKCPYAAPVLAALAARQT